jgi:hypothetical protein
VDAVKEATNRWGVNYGWEVNYYDRESLLIVNIPRYVNNTTATLSYSEQYCMNTNTGAWCRFRDWDAITFQEHEGNLYMGCYDGHIRKVFTGGTDDDNAIKGVCIPSFNMMGSPDRNKQLTVCTITTNHDNKESFGVGGLADFQPEAFGTASAPDKGVPPLWDVPDWDTEEWASEVLETPANYDFSVSNYGYALSTKINMFSNVETIKIFSIRFKYKLGRSI